MIKSGSLSGKENGSKRRKCI